MYCLLNLINIFVVSIRKQTNKKQNIMKARQTKFTRYQTLRELGYNYNWKTVSDKTLKAKLKELKINK